MHLKKLFTPFFLFVASKIQFGLQLELSSKLDRLQDQEADYIRSCATQQGNLGICVKAGSCSTVAKENSLNLCTESDSTNKYICCPTTIEFKNDQKLLVKQRSGMFVLFFFQVHVNFFLIISHFMHQVVV